MVGGCRALTSSQAVEVTVRFLLPVPSSVPLNPPLGVGMMAVALV